MLLSIRESDHEIPIGRALASETPPVSISFQFESFLFLFRDGGEMLATFYDVDGANAALAVFAAELERELGVLLSDGLEL